jgi:hypothetical protein
MMPARIYSGALTEALLAMMLAVILGGCADTCEPSPSQYCEEEEEVCTPMPEYCPRTVPEEAGLRILLSEPLPVRVAVYHGNEYETGTLNQAWAPSKKDNWIEVPLGTYSVTALYVTGGDSVLAVDVDVVDYAGFETCTATCYFSDDGEVDLTLE